MKVFIETYGCTFNQADSEIMAGYLLESDFEIVESMEESDVIIVNTCYVKLPTESKVINRIKSLQKNFPDKIHNIFKFNHILFPKTTNNSSFLLFPKSNNSHI